MDWNGSKWGRHGLLVSALCASLAPSSRAMAQEEVSAPPADEAKDTQSEELAGLKTRVEKQSEELQALRQEIEQRLENEKESREEGAKRAESSVDERIKRAIESSPRVTGIAGLTLSGLVQIDHFVKQQSEDQVNTSTAQPLNEDRFLLRRARIRAAIEERYLAAALELDANSSNGVQARPINAEATVRWPGEHLPLAAATFGLFKIPFGYEVVQRDAERLFAERSQFVRAFFPGEYDLGARLSGGWRFIRYALAVQNGQPLGDVGFPGRDPNAAKDVTGRLGVDAEVAPGMVVRGGFSTLTGKGFHKGVAPTKPGVSWQDRNEDGLISVSELVPSPGSSGQPSMNFSRFVLGADAFVATNRFGFGNTVVYGELAFGKNLDRGYLIADPYGTLGRDYRELGYYLAVVQDLGDVFQAGARYDFYDPDRDSTDRQSGVVLLSSQAVKTIGIAVAARGRSGGVRGRVVAELDLIADNLGRNPGGLPADRKNNVFTLRAEAAF